MDGPNRSGLTLEYVGRHRGDSLRQKHYVMHAQALRDVKPGWFRFLERRGSLKVGRLVYTNPNRSFSAKTLGAVIVLAVAIGVACACGYDLAESMILPLFKR